MTKRKTQNNVEQVEQNNVEQVLNESQFEQVEQVEQNDKTAVNYDELNNVIKELSNQSIKYVESLDSFKALTSLAIQKHINGINLARLSESKIEMLINNLKKEMIDNLLTPLQNSKEIAKLEQKPLVEKGISLVIKHVNASLKFFNNCLIIATKLKLIKHGESVLNLKALTLFESDKNVINFENMTISKNESIAHALKLINDKEHKDSGQIASFLKHAILGSHSDHILQKQYEGFDEINNVIKTSQNAIIQKIDIELLTKQLHAIANHGLHIINNKNPYSAKLQESVIGLLQRIK